MSGKLNALIEEQNTLWARMQEIRRGMDDRDLTAEERTNWDAAEARLTEVSGDIERLERFERLDQIDRSRIVVAGPSGEQDEREAGNETRYAEAFGGYIRRGMGRLPEDQQRLLEAGFVEADSRAQSTQDDTLGGYTVPEGFRAVMTEAMKAFGGIFDLANVINTATGNDLPWPTNDDTGNEGEYLGENSLLNEQNVTFGGRKLKAHTVNSKTVRVPVQLLQDSAFNLDTWLPKKLGERIARRSARAFAVGTGVDQPEGITTNVAVGKTGANGQTTSIIYDDLVDLEHSIDPAYRSRARYVMGDAMLKVIRKLKDSQNRPLWVPIPAPGFTASINGWDYTVDNSFPVPAASAKTIVFGDIAAGYVIRQVQGVQMVRLTERYADSLQVGFLAFARNDAKIDDASAVKAYQHSAS